MTEQTTAVAVVTNESEQEIICQTENTGSLMFDISKFDAIDKMADIMSSGKCTIPKHLQGNKGDCFAIIVQSFQWGMNPYVVAQKTHLVNGTLGYEAQLVHSVVKSMGKISGRFYYEYKGDGQSLECRVGAVIKGEKEITWTEFLTLSDVKIQNSPLWKANPKQQFGYLQIKNWARAYAPEAILGVYTTDELEAFTGVKDTPRYTQPQKITQHEAPSEFITKDNQRQLLDIGKAKKLTSEEMSFIVYSVAGVNKSGEIKPDAFGKVLAAFEAAKPGEVIPKEAN